MQTVRNTIRAFEHKGLVCLDAESSRPKTVKSITVALLTYVIMPRLTQLFRKWLYPI